MAEETAARTDRPGQTIVIRVVRFHPQRDVRPQPREYAVPARTGMTVLDGLAYIKEHLDGSLAYRASCRMGICGSCGMFINGLPRLACQTQLAALASPVVVAAMPNYPLVRDLVGDTEPMVAHHAALRPFIIRGDREQERPSGEYAQSPEALDAYLQFAYCIKCGICLAACPTLATDAEFSGPQALAQAYRYSADSRDDGLRARLGLVDSAHGVWRCHLAGACTEACPKGVDPALAIQLLKRQVVADALRLGRRRQPAPVAPPNPQAQRRADIPEPPPPTVGTAGAHIP